MISDKNINIATIPLIVQQGLIYGPKFIYDNYLNNEIIINKVKNTNNVNLNHQQLLNLANELNDTDPIITNKFNIKVFKQEMVQWLNDNNFIIQNADKNLCITLIDKQIYNTALQQLVNDKSCYTPITHIDAVNIIRTTYNKLFNIFTNFRKAQDLLMFVKFNVKFGFPNLYLIPKIHKPKLSFRPIVNQRNFIFTELYKQIHVYWHNKLCQEELKNSLVLDGNFDFLLKIEEVNKTIKKNNIDLNNYNLISLDVTNLYGNIDLNEIQSCLATCYDYRGKADDLLMLKITQTILFNNIIECNNNLYVQKNGLAMGINYAPSLANIYLFHRYDKVFKNALYDSDHKYNPILFYGRYLDDILILYHKKWNIEQFVHNRLNKIHPSIQFTTEFNTNNIINFLDLTLSLDLNNNEITYKNFIKLLKVNTMLHAKAKFNQKSGLIKSQSIRLLKNNRNESDYLLDIELLTEQLQTRGYNKQLIDANIEPYSNRSKYMDPEYTKNKTSKFEENIKGNKLVVLDYHNRINIVKNAITNASNSKVYFINRNYQNLYNTFFNNIKNTKLQWEFNTKYITDPTPGQFIPTQQPEQIEPKKIKYLIQHWLNKNNFKK